MIPAPIALGRRQALVIALIGLAAVSHAAVFIRLADAPALVIAFARVALATAVFLPFGALAARGLARLERPARRRCLGLALLAGAFLALHFACWIGALKLVTIAEATVLTSLTPIWVALVDMLTGRGAPGRALLVAIALCLAGTAVLAAGGLARVDGDPLGLLLAVGGGVFMALYLVAGRKARRRLATPLYVTLCYGSASALLLAAALASGAALGGYTPETWAALAALGLVSQVIGHTSYNWTLSTLPPVFVAICLLGEPVFGAALGFLYLGEAIPPAALAGGVLILAGIGVALRAELRAAG